MKSLISRLAMAATLCLPAPLIAAPVSGPADADAFVVKAEKDLGDFSVLSNRAAWINATYITDDTDALAAEFGARATEMGVRFAKGAAKFDGVAGLSPDTRRKLDFLKQGLVLPAPDWAAERRLEPEVA